MMRFKPKFKNPFIIYILAAICVSAFIFGGVSGYFIRGEVDDDIETGYSSRIDNLIEDNNELFYRLSKYEQKDWVWATNWIINKNHTVDVKVAREFAEHITRYAEDYEIDYKLVLAVIWQESKFNPTSRSRMGAHGLMQIMPDTQKAIAERLGNGPYDMSDPEQNIMFGCNHLSYLLKIYSDNIPLALSSYNGGPINAVKYREYMNGKRTASTLNAENYNYVKLITTTYNKMRIPLER